jgi:polyphosphate kinase
MNSKNRIYTNRELSWLEFNERILDQARDSKVPLLERVKFLAISASNLDEFFMVRIGGLLQLINEGAGQQDNAGLSPAEQISAINSRVHRMIDEQYRIYNTLFDSLLKKHDIVRVGIKNLDSEQFDFISMFFTNEIYPLLSPASLGGRDEPMLIFNRTLNLLVRLKKTPAVSKFALVAMPRLIGRFIKVPSASGMFFILIEDIIAHFAEKLFPGETILETVPFRITRNADLSVSEDNASDLLAEMENVIDARKRSDCVRLETTADVSSVTKKYLHSYLKIDNTRTYLLDGPIDLSACSKMVDFQSGTLLRYVPQIPQQSPDIPPGKTMFEVIAKKSIVLVHPYESFEPVLRFIDEAADDPDVVTIKQILYRTSKDSPIIDALKRAAEKGKNVTALVELKARFDEERNIEWAHDLEDSGVQVVYGVKELKTHAKVCLVIRRENQGLVRYMHFGTGNYNEITAHLYSDVSYLTCNEELGADTSAFFNAITGYSQPLHFKSIEMAPVGVREKLIELIENEIERKKQGHDAFIRAKMNSLVDQGIIEKLYNASKTGVKIELNIRGICCLKPGIKGLSDTITVISIVDRYLEHARIFQFCHGGENLIYMSTADWMPRNLDKRIELMVPIGNPAAKKRLSELLDICFSDNCNAWKLNSDGIYVRCKPGKIKKLRAQEILYEKVCTAIQSGKRNRRTVFEPHKPDR